MLGGKQKRVLSVKKILLKKTSHKHKQIELIFIELIFSLKKTNKLIFTEDLGKLGFHAKPTKKKVVFFV